MLLAAAEPEALSAALHDVRTQRGNRAKMIGARVRRAVLCKRKGQDAENEEKDNRVRGGARELRSCRWRREQQCAVKSAGVAFDQGGCGGAGRGGGQKEAERSEDRSEEKVTRGEEGDEDRIGDSTGRREWRRQGA
eukprot:3137150-Rhodomonas_salina.1